MKTLLLLLLTASTCLAQYRVKQLSSTTNTVALANTNITFGNAYDVGSGSRAELLFSFNLTSSTNTGTNPIVLTFDRGLESPYFTNQFTLSLSAKTNATVWTNITVGVTNDVFIRLVSLTNHNAVTASNVYIKLFQKIGF
jgi:hypothetical protein